MFKDSRVPFEKLCLSNDSRQQAAQMYTGFFDNLLRKAAGAPLVSTTLEVDSSEGIEAIVIREAVVADLDGVRQVAAQMVKTSIWHMSGLEVGETSLFYCVGVYNFSSAREPNMMYQYDCGIDAVGDTMGVLRTDWDGAALPPEISPHYPSPERTAAVEEQVLRGVNRLPVGIEDIGGWCSEMHNANFKQLPQPPAEPMV